jgi:hypothetical protein
VRFANASEKRNLLAKVVADLGCADTRTASRAGIPAQNDLFFTPNDEMQRAFARMPGEWALQAADSIVGLATEEELEIYNRLISLAREGRFDGCVLPETFAVHRFTFIPMSKLGTIPGTSREQQEALQDRDRVYKTLRSVRDLATRSICLTNGRADDAPDISFGRIGFSRNRSSAVVLFSYRAGVDVNSCTLVSVAFLSRQGGTWDVTGYSTP